MIKNCFIQDQINFNIIQTNVFMSLSRRFRSIKNVHFIHDSVCAHSTGDWEECLMSRAITLAYNHNINRSFL